MEIRERRKAGDFPPEVMKLFDGYVHGGLTRREFLDRAGKYALGGMTAAAMLESLQPNFAWAEQVKKNDPRIKTGYMDTPRPAAREKCAVTWRSRRMPGANCRRSW